MKDQRGLLAMVDGTIAPMDPPEVFELLWAFLQLAPSIHAQTDDSNGAIGDVMAETVELIARLMPRLSPDPDALAQRILEAVVHADPGEFDGIIPATAEALGPRGLDHLKAMMNAWADQLPTAQEMEAYCGFGQSLSPTESVRRSKDTTRSVILADIAYAQGDVDAYMARIRPRS